MSEVKLLPLPEPPCRGKGWEPQDTVREVPELAEIADFINGELQDWLRIGGHETFGDVVARQLHEWHKDHVRRGELLKHATSAKDTEIEALRVQLRVAQQQGQAAHVECRECRNCAHVGINDESETQAACHSCEWSGDSPQEDKCPGCGDVNCMAAACPKCGALYHLLAEADVPADTQQQGQAVAR